MTDEYLLAVSELELVALNRALTDYRFALLKADDNAAQGSPYLASVHT